MTESYVKIDVLRRMKYQWYREIMFYEKLIKLVTIEMQ